MLMNGFDRVLLTLERLERLVEVVARSSSSLPTTTGFEMNVLGSPMPALYRRFGVVLIEGLQSDEQYTDFISINWPADTRRGRPPKRGRGGAGFLVAGHDGQVKSRHVSVMQRHDETATEIVNTTSTRSSRADGFRVCDGATATNSIRSPRLTLRFKAVIRGRVHHGDKRSAPSNRHHRGCKTSLASRERIDSIRAAMSA